jgi:hypothetical protein
LRDIRRYFFLVEIAGGILHPIGEKLLRAKSKILNRKGRKVREGRPAKKKSRHPEDVFPIASEDQVWNGAGKEQSLKARTARERHAS